MEIKCHFSLIFCLSLVYAHITRLPCVKHALFSYVINKYQSGSIVITLTEDVSKKNCAFKCIVNELCVFVNYKQDGSRCELLSSVNGEEEALIGWEIMRTNTDDKTNIGPICEKHSPCKDGELCRDVCENNTNKYKCQGFRNIASSAIVTSSSNYPGHYGDNCIDGDLETICSTDKKEANPYLKFDLGKMANISTIKVHNRPGLLNRIMGAHLFVSKDDVTYDTIAVLTNALEQTYDCYQMIKYLKIQQEAPEYLNIMQFEIFSYVEEVLPFV